MVPEECCKAVEYKGAAFSIVFCILLVCGVRRTAECLPATMDQVEST